VGRCSPPARTWDEKPRNWKRGKWVSAAGSLPCLPGATVCHCCSCCCSRRDGQRGTQDRGALTRSPSNRAPSYPGSFLFFQVLVTTYIHISYGKERTPREPCFGFDPAGSLIAPRSSVFSGLFLPPPINEFKIQDSFLSTLAIALELACPSGAPPGHRVSTKPGERIWTWKWSRTLRNPHRFRRQPRLLLLGVRGPSNTESPGGATGLRCRASSAGRAKSDAIAMSRAPAA
jgi:hypothetical protein